MTPKDRALRRNALKPTGDLILRTKTMVNELNTHGSVFGGWILAQLDMCAAMAAGARARGEVVTAGAADISFLRPVPAGSTIEGYAHLQHVGRSSLNYGIELWVRSADTGEASIATVGIFTMVAIDVNGKPSRVPPN